MNRRQFLASVAALTSAASSDSQFALAQASKPTTAATTRGNIPEDVVWHDVCDWGVEGRGFNDTGEYFQRLPARAKALVRPEVWKLSLDTSGMSARFETDSTDIYVRHTALNPTLAMAHMPATSVSGLDLYAKHENGWRWVGTYQPKEQSSSGAIASRLAPARR